MNVLISVDELRELPEVVLLDVRWMLGGPPGRDEYRTGHIPGAVFVDLETELAAHGEPTDGRHPLPSLSACRRPPGAGACARDVPVVAYDGNGNLAAARAWWLLRWAGVRDVRLLDGALAAWVTAGGDLDVDDVVPGAGRHRPHRRRAAHARPRRGAAVLRGAARRPRGRALPR